MKRGFLAIAFIGLGLVGCEQLKNLGQVSFTSGYTAEVDMPVVADSATSITGDTTIDVRLAYATNVANILSDENTSPEKLISVRLRDLSMELTTPLNQNFDFLSSIKVYIYGDNLPELLAAEKLNIAKGVRNVQVDTMNVEFKPYLLKDSLHFRLNARINKLPQIGTKVNLDSKFRITANPIK